MPLKIHDYITYAKINWSSSKIHNSNLFIRTNPGGGTVYKISPQNRQGLSNAKLENHHNQEAPPETGPLNVLWCPAWDPRTPMGYYVKTKEIVHQVQT